MAGALGSPMAEDQAGGNGIRLVSGGNYVIQNDIS